MKRYLITLVIMLVLLTGCAGATSEKYAAEESYAPAGVPMMDADMAVESESMSNEAREGSSSSGTSVEATQQERLVIKNANLSITVADPEEKIEAITALATSLGGYVVSSNTYQSYANSGEQVPEGNITIRIPAGKLDSALAQIKAGVDEVNSENVSGEDVTDQYVDLQSRLDAKEAAEAQMLKIMEDATTTEETLAVYSELQYIQSDIEVLKGQINYYERSAATSSISTEVIATEKAEPIEIGGWELGATASKAIQNLINYLQGFMQFIINFILFVLPVLFTLILPFYLVFIAVRAIIRRRKNKKVKEE